MRREIYVLLRALLASGALLALWGCGPDDAAEPDPCAGIENRLADFDIADWIGGKRELDQLIYHPDTVFYNSSLVFRSKIENARHTWIIEDDTLYYEDSKPYPAYGLSRFLPPYEDFENGPISITLICELNNLADSTCYGGKMRDTLKKTLHVIKGGTRAQAVIEHMTGTYEYFNTAAPNEIRELKIKYGHAPRTNYVALYPTGIPEDCPVSITEYRITNNYVCFWDYPGLTCGGAYYCTNEDVLNRDDTLTIYAKRLRQNDSYELFTEDLTYKAVKISP